MLVNGTWVDVISNIAPGTTLTPTHLEPVDGNQTAQFRLLYNSTNTFGSTTAEVFVATLLTRDTFFASPLLVLSKSGIFSHTVSGGLPVCVALRGYPAKQRTLVLFCSMLEHVRAHYAQRMCEPHI